MTDFNYNKKESYTQEDMDKNLKEYDQFKTKQLKSEFDSKEKDYQTKLNNYEEKELFNGLNDKQIKLAKSLLNNDDYKSLSKQEALNKIKQDYDNVFTNTSNDPKPDKPDKKDFNFADLTKLDELLNNDKSTKLEEKAKTKGLTEKDELVEYTKQVFSKVK